VDPDRLVEAFPAPSFRGNQERALRDIGAAFEAGHRVVLVRAPTGSGKSLLARAVMGACRRADEASATDAIGAYYTTPQVAQLDAVEADPLLPDLAVVRGKRNYDCILPTETDVPVDRARCVRERGFDCDVRHRCPYFSDREIAANRRYAAMTLAYFMRTAGSDAFGRRDVVVIDEAHGLAEWAELYATIELGRRTVPGWSDVSVPDLPDVETAAGFAARLADRLEIRLETLRGADALTPDEVAERDRLAERVGELRWFAEDVERASARRESAAGDAARWAETEWLVDQTDEAVRFLPMNPARYLRHTVWDRGERFCLLSATILDKAGFCRGVGLDPAEVALVDVPHTFPLEHRPLYDVAAGRMTYEHRADTLPKLARLLVRLMARHPDEKGLVHAHSYGIQRELAERLGQMGVGGRVRTHDRGDRDDQLAGWLATDRPEVFLGVTMEEALDLEGDLARWQVLCKAPFPNTRDARVAHRLERGQWDWYNRAALRTVIQACGRVVRSVDDTGATYLADASLLDLFERARGDLPPWFAEQVAAMTTPDLPDFDPAAALAGLGESPSPAASGSPGQGRSRGERRAARGRRGATRRASSGEGGGAIDGLPADHPLHDVWG